MAVAGEQQQPVESESWKRGNMRIGKMLNEWFGRWELTRFVSSAFLGFSYFKVIVGVRLKHCIFTYPPTPRIVYLLLVIQVVCISIVCCCANSCDIKGSSVFQRLD